MNKKTINQYRQNKLSLIVDDLKFLELRNNWNNEDNIYESLLKRGIFKWLCVRQKIIRLKLLWKYRLQQSLLSQKASIGPQVNYWRGYRKALEQCRQELRAICHGPRWDVPTNDRRATKWLRKREKK